MTPPVILHGYRYSVYTRIARVVLHEKGVEYHVEEVDPFAEKVAESYLKRHPFRRVPVLSHGDFDVFETVAIARYVDAHFDGPQLSPPSAQAAARAAQVISIIDSYGYIPMVRQVFAHRVFRPAVGKAPDEDEIAKGLAASRTVLAALNTIAAEGHILNARTFTLAECHLAPMIAYFIQAPEGARALEHHGALAQWWASTAKRESLLSTDPGLPDT